MIYPDKYQLTPEQSRFLAKKKWTKMCIADEMENRAVTFPQTRTILDGVTCRMSGLMISRRF